MVKVSVCLAVYKTKPEYLKECIDSILILDEKRPRKSGKYADLITFVKDRAGHDKRYAIDATKLETKLGWKAEETFDSGIVKTVEWYLK